MRMKPWIKLTVILIIVLGIVTVSCRRINEYPPEPVIKFTGFDKILKDNDTIFERGILKFEYTDGDGDLGLEDADTFPPFHP